MQGKVWFITGAANGFGRLCCEAALKRGERVVATTRDIRQLQELADRYGDAMLRLQLDVTDRSQVFDAVQRGRDHFGRLCVVVAAAGYAQYGAVEEVSPDEARVNIETRVFGTLWVVQAALLILRAQGFGHILAVAGPGGATAPPLVFPAADFAVAGMAEALASEVAGFGIKVTIVETGTHPASLPPGPSARQARPLPAYDGVREQLRASIKPAMPDDPAAVAAAIFKVVDSSQPPLRLVLGP